MQVLETMPDPISSPTEENLSLASCGDQATRRARPFFWLALCLLYVVAILPRLRSSDYDEPTLTYGDENGTAGQAEFVLSKPGGKIELFHKAPGIPHFLILTFQPYYWLVKAHFGWQSVDDVQWWRVRHYWRALNILLGSLVIFVAGAIGARAFNLRVGLLTAALCAVSRLCAVWFTFLKEEALMTLACTIAIYAACRLFAKDGSRWRWIALGGLATGCALAFKYNAAPVGLFFLVALFLSNDPADQRGKLLKGLSRFRRKEVLLYLLVSVATFLAWFPQLFTRPGEVWRSLSTLQQFTRLDVTQHNLPPVHQLLTVARDAWKNSFYAFRDPALTDTYPLYFFALMMASLIVVPIYAIVRRHRFLLALSFFVWLMYLVVCYQWLFTPWRFSHYFLPAIVPIYLVVAYGADRIAEGIARRMQPVMAFRTEAIQCVLLVLLCAWPLWDAYRASVIKLATIRSTVGSVKQSRTFRRSLVRTIPVGARVFIPDDWVSPYISDSLFDNRHFKAWRFPQWGGTTYAELVQQGFDVACMGEYHLLRPEIAPVFLRELVDRNVQTVRVLPQLSHFMPGYLFFPVHPLDQQSFNLSLYFREPSEGDYAGIRGIRSSPAMSGDRATSPTAILEAHLFNGERWFPGFIRWEVSLDGKTIWQGRETTDTKQACLSLPIVARPGSEILIRTMRTGFRPEATWGWGGLQSHLKVDALNVFEAGSSKPLAILWSYTGRNGGPGPARYAMRRDWLHNADPVALLDTGFEGPQPLVEAWRPLQWIEPRGSHEIKEQGICRNMARVETAPRLGQDGSTALRFIVEYPAKESATLGVMQPIAYPACQRVRSLRVHYRAVETADGGGEVCLRFVATALSLSGEYIDRAEAAAYLIGASGQWQSLELDLAKTWKQKHTRTDLIDFLEVAIEARTGPGSVSNCLIDNVDVE